MRPALVIGDLKVEQELVPVAGGQEQGVVAVRLFCFPVFAETLVRGVVILVIGGPGPPLVAFDPEMIIGFPGQRAVSSVRLQDAMRQGNACRYPVGFHFFYSQVFVLLDILRQCNPFLGIGQRYYS